MYESVDSAVTLAGRLEDAVADLARAGRSLPEVVVCPPFTALTAVGDVLADNVLKLGAQDVYPGDHGAVTGMIGTDQLHGLVDYVLLGHPERRRLGETDQQVAAKVAAAASAGLQPVICVGETEDDGTAVDVVSRQLTTAVSELPSDSPAPIVAYEPLWAVGTGTPAESVQVAEMVQAIRTCAAAAEVELAAVLYGGSLTKETVAPLAAVNELDGVLLGAASRQPADFAAIVEQVA